MVTLHGVDEVVIFAATPEKLTQALNGITGEIVHCTVMPGPPFVAKADTGPTPEGFAAEFNGRPYGSEIHPAEELALKAAGMVAVFGYSDDCTEFRGAIHDEVGTGELRITAKGKILNIGEFEALESLAADGTVDVMPPIGIIQVIRADSGDTMIETGNPHSTITIEAGPAADILGDAPAPEWRYNCNIPHATFDIVDGGALFCRGIVFRLADIGTEVQP